MTETELPSPKQIETIRATHRLKQVLRVVVLNLAGTSILEACRRVGIDDAAYYRWLSKPEIRAAVTEFRDRLLDATALEASLAWAEIVRAQIEIAKGTGEDSTRAARLVKEIIDESRSRMPSAGMTAPAPPPPAAFRPTFNIRTLNLELPGPPPPPTVEIVEPVQIVPPSPEDKPAETE